jgi:Protein of unknown function (DUF4240)
MVVKISLKDLSHQFVQDLTQRFGKTAEVEIRVQESPKNPLLLTETDFWQIIEKLDWSKAKSADVLEPAVKMLADMPMPNIYLFEDKLSEKLYLLDTKQHAAVFSEEDFSSDDFLYSRCAVIGEGKSFFDSVLKNPKKMPQDITFEALLNLASDAYYLKTGQIFNYKPTYNYETSANRLGWA